MTRFADQLFEDLMEDHGPALEMIQLPQTRRAVPRPIWLAAGVVGMAGAITAGVTIAGGSSPAYAVTDNGDGTVTVSIDQLTGVDGANGALRALGDPVVVVPVRAGCPSLRSLEITKPIPHNRPIEITGEVSAHGGTVKVQAHGIPAGDLVLVAASTGSNGTITMAMELIKGPAPSCVGELPAPPAGSGPNSSGGSGTMSGSGNAGSTTSTGH